MERSDTEPYLAKKVGSGLITQSDADLILEHLYERQAQRGISDETVRTSASYIALLRDHTPEFEQCTTADVMKAVAAIRRLHLRPNTERKYILHIKQFFAWLDERGIAEIDISKIDKVKAPPAEWVTKTPEQMLTINEVQRIIGACRNSRDRAMLAVLYEGALRPIEITKMNWKQIEFDRYGAKLTTDGKTGKRRHIRLLMSAQYLAVWQADYPGGASPDAPIFVRLRGSPAKMTRGAMRKVIERAAKRAGVEKPIHPYLFRHSRITHWVETGLSESVIKLQSWGDLKSPMLATYAHVSDAAIDKAVLEHAGIRRREERREEPKPVQCPQCDTVNAPNSPACYVCGCPLTRGAKYTVEMLLAAMLKEYPEVADALMQAAEGKLTQDRTAVGE
jgi:site-specific recombinase XerD